MTGQDYFIRFRVSNFNFEINYYIVEKFLNNTEFSNN